MSVQLEICCYNLNSALIAQDAGAHRVELCADPSAGGTTPAVGTIKKAREKLSIPLYPIIRARGGDFIFSDEEFEIMRHDVSVCKKLGCDGVVIGLLLPNGKIDRDECARLVELAYPMGVTFHRAFDWVENPFDALETVIDIGCERILTSGQQPEAMLGATLIADLIRQAAGRIIIMPGSGIRAHNIADIISATGAEEIHSSARKHVRTNMEYINPLMKDDMSTTMADRHEIEAMINIVRTEID